MSPARTPANILNGLREIQGFYGWLPPDELDLLALRLGVSLPAVLEVASYFPTFRVRLPPVGTHVSVGVCRDMVCHLRNPRIRQDVEAAYSGAPDVTVEGVSCLGRCDLAPVVHLHSTRTTEFDRDERSGLVVDGPEVFRTFRSMDDLRREVDQFRQGHANGVDEAGSSPADDEPWWLDVYPAGEAGARPPFYEAVRRFTANQIDGRSLIDALMNAELEGLGGAAARIFNKWESVYQQSGAVKYVVANGDESEPGTFKDREVLRRLPHQVVEGMVLALLYLSSKPGCTAREGFIYIRHEYPDQLAAVRAAVRDAEDLLKSHHLTLHVVASPGGYICGEQSSLLEALEGKRAQPRLRNGPSDIQTNGLWNCPTILNNVETLAWVPTILLRPQTGTGSFVEQGLPGDCEPKGRYKGKRFFSISGDVRRPGVYEMPMGATLGELLRRAGGVKGERLWAVAPSGSSGGFLPARLRVADLVTQLDKEIKRLRAESVNQKPRLERFLDRLRTYPTPEIRVEEIELTTALFRALDLMLGSGIVVYAAPEKEGRDMMPHALNCLQFFRNESCGKCVPCRLGTQELVAIAEGAPDQAQVSLLQQAMKETSICGLGKYAAMPLATVLRYFPVDHPARNSP